MATKVATTLEAYEALGNRKDFVHQSAFVGLNDLSLMASTNTPVSYRVADDDSHYFVMPFKGKAACTIGSKHYVSSPDDGAMIIPGEARSGTTTDLSMLQATLNSARLMETARIMLGEIKPEAIRQRVQSPQLLRSQAGQLRFTQVFEKVCGLVDAMNSSAESLTRIGFDDFFYRAVVSHVFHEQFANPTVGRSRPQTTTLRQLCDYIDANLTRTIFLTELEKFANLSARAIQYEFLRQFGCSPMAWILERRLQLAHQRLLRAGADDSVTKIALDCGFTNLGRFAMCYRTKFGEAPSDTLKRTR